MGHLNFHATLNYKLHSSTFAGIAVFTSGGDSQGMYIFVTIFQKLQTNATKKNLYHSRNYDKKLISYKMIQVIHIF